MHGGLTLRFWGPFFLGLVCLLGRGVCNAEEVNWAAWEEIPVLDRGRLMPLDTFARHVVRDICDREKPRLAPPVDLETLSPKTQAAIRRLFPEGEPRKFSAAELLYSWTVEPEVWAHIPFLYAGNETLREKVLDVPIYDSLGNRLKYISPLEFQEASSAIVEFHEATAQKQREANREKRGFKPNHEEKALLELISAYNLYSSVVFDPNEQAFINQEFQSQFLKVAETWKTMTENLAPRLQVSQPDGKFLVAVKQVKDSLTILSQQFRLPETDLTQLAIATSDLADAAAKLMGNTEKLRDRVFEAGSKETGIDNRKIVNQLAAETEQLAQSSRLLQRAIFEGGRSLRVIPSLSRWALEKDRDVSTLNSPWINLQTLLYAPEAVLDGFPPEKVTAIRKLFAASKQAYQEFDATQDDAQQAETVRKLNTSLQDFSKNLRELGESLSAEREKIKLHEPDKELLTKTAYPPTDTFAVELHYNRLDPTLWSWILTLGAVVCFALAIGNGRTPMTVLAVVLLVLGQVATCYGLGLRMAITKMVPVTNMHETILFVGATTGILTVFYAILPMIQNGLVTAWRLTAWPRSSEARSMREEQLRLAGPLASSVSRWSIFAIRSALIAGMLYALAVGPFAPDGKRTVLNLLTGMSGQGVGGLLGAVALWIVGGALLVWTFWFFPRAIPTLVLAVVLVPVSWIQNGFRDGVRQAVDRRFYLLAGAVVALLIYLIGYFTPNDVFNRDVGMGMAAALQNNFWLAIHVLVITASYGAGALAWGIGNVSAGMYLFGKYTDGQPPKATHTLAHSIYRMMQIAILLLAAGTITGAIWADFAWGRYWGWDPKEIWALITLFVYLAILHGRWARWIGDFGMAFGAVLGFVSIIIAWYGVNILGGGLHSYGAASGGFLYIWIGALANGCFLAVALIRYVVEGGLENRSD